MRHRLAHDPQALERIADTAGPVRSNPVRLARQLSANLALLPPTGAVVVASPLPIRGGSGSPARVLAFVER